MTSRLPVLRVAHGRAAELGRLTASETPPADELPAGVPGDARNESPTDRGHGGHFARGNALAAAGGRAKAGRTRLASSLGLADMDGDPAFGPYKRAAEAFRRAHCASLASTVGGGECGTGPASIVASAAWALAGSRFLFDTAAGDAKKLSAAANLAKEHRASLRDAHALCALEAQARRAATRSTRGPLAHVDSLLELHAPADGDAEEDDE